MIKPCGHKTGANSCIQHAANQSPCTTGDVLEGTVYCAINTRLMSQNTMTGVGGCGGYTKMQCQIEFQLTDVLTCPAHMCGQLIKCPILFAE